MRRPLIVFALAIRLLMFDGDVQAETKTPPLETLKQWEYQMLKFGAQHCMQLQDSSLSPDAKLLTTYYDAERVFYAIADYTRDPRWLDCADAAERIYRDQYVLAQNPSGAVPGYWIFPHGLWIDAARTQDKSSVSALLGLAYNASFASGPLEWTADASASREVAYNINTKLLAQAVAGYPDRDRLTALIEQAFGHMDQWFGKGSAPYIRPFMVALTSEALIAWHKQTGDARVLPALKRAADRLWDCCWLSDAQAFMYTNRVAADGSGDMTPAPDLNLLIAPVYGWVYWQTGDPQYRDKGDAIFNGGVVSAYLINGKQFDQSYRWSFDYVSWRDGATTPMYALLPGPGMPGVGMASSGDKGFSSASTTSPSSPRCRNKRHQEECRKP